MGNASAQLRRSAVIQPLLWLSPARQLSRGCEIQRVSRQTRCKVVACRWPARTVVGQGRGVYELHRGGSYCRAISGNATCTPAEVVAAVHIARRAAAAIGSCLKMPLNLSKKIWRVKEMARKEGVFAAFRAVVRRLRQGPGKHVDVFRHYAFALPYVVSPAHGDVEQRTLL